MPHSPATRQSLHADPLDHRAELHAMRPQGTALGQNPVRGVQEGIQAQLRDTALRCYGSDLRLGYWLRLWHVTAEHQGVTASALDRNLAC